MCRCEWLVWPPRQTHNLPFKLTAVSVREAYHLGSGYFTTQVSNSDTAQGQRAASIAARTERRANCQPQCQVSPDGALKCLLLYCNNVVMYGEAQGAEQKQEGEEMYML